MTQQPKSDASPRVEPAPVPDTPSASESDEEARDIAGAWERPSDAATADVEERQDSHRASEREKGRPPADAPSY
jgi:hypothetical protein